MACVNVLLFTVEKCPARPCAPREGRCGNPGTYDVCFFVDWTEILRRELPARTAAFVAEAVRQEYGPLYPHSRQLLCLKHAADLAAPFPAECHVPAQMLDLLPAYTLIGSLRFDAQEPQRKRLIVKRILSGVNILVDRMHELNWHYRRDSLELLRLDHCAQPAETA